MTSPNDAAHGQNRPFKLLSPSMKSDIENLLRESRAWLSAQDSPTAQSQKWDAFGNFKLFLDRIELKPVEAEIASAVHALRHHISDQFDWSAVEINDF